jgi:hypothetical protein
LKPVRELKDASKDYSLKLKAMIYIIKRRENFIQQ